MPMTTDRRTRIPAAAVGFATLAYLCFVAVFGYTIAFVAGGGVPRTVDGGGPRSGTVTAVAIDCALLALFAVQHTVMARPAFKRRWTQLIPASVERSTYVLTSSAVLALICWQWRAVPHVVWDVQPAPARVLIWIVCAVGWLLVFSMTFAIDHWELVGLRQLSQRRDDAQPTTAQLRTPLPYRLVRHPMMTGFFIALVATPTMTAGHLLFAVMSCGYIVIGVRFEERDLAATLPHYSDYAARTPRFCPRMPERQRQGDASLSP